MEIKFNIEDVILTLQIDYNDFNGTLIEALRQHNMASDYELENYVPDVHDDRPFSWQLRSP